MFFYAVVFFDAVNHKQRSTILKLDSIKPAPFKPYHRTKTRIPINGHTTCNQLTLYVRTCEPYFFGFRYFHPDFALFTCLHFRWNIMRFCVTRDKCGQMCKNSWKRGQISQENCILFLMLCHSLNTNSWTISLKYRSCLDFFASDSAFSRLFSTIQIWMQTVSVYCNDFDRLHVRTKSRN